MSEKARTSPFPEGGGKVCNRRFFPVGVHPGEGRLTERTADARACRYELVLMPLRRCSYSEAET